MTEKLITINIHIRQNQEHWWLSDLPSGCFCVTLLSLALCVLGPYSDTHNCHTVWTCRHSSTLIPPSLSRFLFHLINSRREAAYKKYKMLSISQLRPKYTVSKFYCTSCKVVSISVTKNHYQKNWLTWARLLNVFLGLFTGWEHDALWGISISKRNTNPLNSYCTQHTYSYHNVPKCSWLFTCFSPSN